MKGLSKSRLQVENESLAFVASHEKDFLHENGREVVASKKLKF